ncbi:MAG: PIN domain-containing protein [Anaerolineae bacterium]|nr:PIN domain-containing protein [Anaerolineae bacterium]
MDKILIDTNVLIYAYDRSEPQKQRQALHVLDRLARDGNGVLAMQVLVEFAAVALRKLPATLTPKQVEERVSHYAQIFQVLPTTLPVLQTGLRGVQDHALSFWDAQIWAIAQLYGIGVIFSEDFNTGAAIGGVRFANPFAPDFDFAAWGM